MNLSEHIDTILVAVGGAAGNAWQYITNKKRQKNEDDSLVLDNVNKGLEISEKILAQVDARMEKMRIEYENEMQQLLERIKTLENELEKCKKQTQY